MNGVPMGVIAVQLGHADTRMTEKHYVHLAPSYVAQTIRDNFPRLGLADEPKVVSIGWKAAQVIVPRDSKHRISGSAAPRSAARAQKCHEL